MNSFEYRDPSRFAFNEYVNQTTMHPAVVIVFIIIFLMLFFVRTRYWFMMVACLVCLAGPAQRVIVLGVDFQLLRLMGVIGVGIAVIRGEFRDFKWNTLDTLVFSAAMINPLMAALRGQSGSVMMHAGMGVDSVSMYLLGRVAIRCLDDFYAVSRSLVVLGLPLMVFFLIEKLTARNLFSVFGGIPELTALRFGKLRAQGAFVHPIIAGCWFAAAIPLIAILFRTSRAKVTDQWLGGLGILFCAVSILATASSTPLASLLAAIFGLCLFRYRAHVPMLWKTGFFLAILLHFVSQSGFHHILYARISFVAGSTGHFRYRLADAAINQFNNWFLIGQNGTYSWGWGLDDCTHEFILTAVKGGLLGLVILLAILTVAFRRVGTLLRSERPDVRWAGYCIGVSIFAHIVSFNGTAYFGQIVLLYYFTLGALQTLSVREGRAIRTLPPGIGNRRTADPDAVRRRWVQPT